MKAGTECIDGGSAEGTGTPRAYDYPRTDYMRSDMIPVIFQV